MERFKNIEHKLERFISKYYRNELLKGLILFLAFGVLYFLLTLLIEYFFWLSSAGRAVLFWLFIGVELALLFKFVAIPLMRLFKLSKGIDYHKAAQIIGDYFPEVSDKLINTLQLHSAAGDSELMLASIEQKSTTLEPIPFRLAINFKQNAKYLKYLIIPVIVFLAANYIGKDAVFATSYERVVNYNEAYEPPAPFSFFVLNESLKAIENKDFKLNIRTVGDVIPDEAAIHFNDEVYFLQQIAPGEYTFTFEQPREDLSFYLKANKVTSTPYTLEVLEVPVLVDFEMELDYPNYTQKRTEHIENTGNAVIPEGTKVSWKLRTRQTDDVALKLKDTTYAFSPTATDEGGKTFDLSRAVYKNTSYAVSTSNANLKDYENLAYNLQVIKDQYPDIDLKAEVDSVSNQQTYFYGKISDDYGLKKLRLVYYPAQSETKLYRDIAINKGNVDEFIYAFPDTLTLEKGQNYEYYFEVFDNDALHNFKSTKSSLFSFLKLTDGELEQQQLEQQEQTIDQLDRSLNKLQEREKELQELSRLQKEKAQLNFNDQKKLQNFLKRQQQQEKILEQFSEQLKENLEEFQKENQEEDPFKEELKERLKRQEEKLKENEKLREELERLREKISKEELTEKLENLVKQNKNDKKNLEQILELTKRYYVQKKAEKIAKDLEKLADKQEELSKKDNDENNKEAQEELNKEFEKLSEELKALEKENKELKRPMEIPSDPKKEAEIKEEQQGASEELEKQEQQEQQDGSPQDKSAAQKQQKKAAQKMRQMADKMKQGMAMSGEQALQEDAKMLRQILDNLLIFSFEEEELMEEMSGMDNKNPSFARKLRYQNVLKQNFKHVDDSLYALSLRRPELNEIINETLTDVDYNMDKALERLAENRILQGLSNQKYVITGANTLADFLSESLDQMQNQMMGQGQGQGKQGQGQGQGMQLPDIIQSQDELNKQMQEGGKGEQKGKGKNGKEGENGEGENGEGEGGQEGEGQQNGEGQEGGQGEGGKGNGGDSNGEGEGEGNGADEYERGLLYEIYKEQQQLRQQLQDQIERNGLGGNAEELVREMKAVEQQLLDKGFNNETLERMTRLKHELLKLKEATFQQGEEEQREARTNLRQYVNPVNANLEKARKYFNANEILNRNTLPLKGVYKKKVQEYFQQRQ